MKWKMARYHTERKNEPRKIFDLEMKYNAYQVISCVLDLRIGTSLTVCQTCVLMCNRLHLQPYKDDHSLQPSSRSANEISSAVFFKDGCECFKDC